MGLQSKLTASKMTLPGDGGNGDVDIDVDVVDGAYKKNKSRTKDRSRAGEKSGARQRSNMRIYFARIRTDVSKESIFKERFETPLFLYLVDTRTKILQNVCLIVFLYGRRPAPC